MGRDGVVVKELVITPVNVGPGPSPALVEFLWEDPFCDPASATYMCGIAEALSRSLNNVDSRLTTIKKRGFILRETFALTLKEHSCLRRCTM